MTFPFISFDTRYYEMVEIRHNCRSEMMWIGIWVHINAIKMVSSVLINITSKALKLRRPRLKLFSFQMNIAQLPFVLIHPYIISRYSVFVGHQTITDPVIPKSLR